MTIGQANPNDAAVEPSDEQLNGLLELPEDVELKDPASVADLEDSPYNAYKVSVSKVSPLSPQESRMTIAPYPTLCYRLFEDEPEALLGADNLIKYLQYRFDVEHTIERFEGDGFELVVEPVTASPLESGTQVDRVNQFDVVVMADEIEAIAVLNEFMKSANFLY